MNPLVKRFLTVALLFGGLIAWSLAAEAQFQTPPPNTSGLYPPAQTQGMARGYNAPPPAPTYAPYTNPNNVGYGGYVGPYGAAGNAAGSYLQGRADVITSVGNYQVQKQQARSMDEQNKQSQLQTRRDIFNEIQYEKENTPTLEDQREQDRQQYLRRARNDPPLTEIISALPLNDLFNDIKRIETEYAIRGPFVPLDPYAVQRINLTDGTTRGSTSQFKPGMTFDWPLVLERDEFAPERKALEESIPAAIAQLSQYGKVPAAMQNQLNKTVDRLRGKINDMVKDLTPDEYISGNRYANQLRDGIKDFNNPNAANFYNGKWQAQANNVGELVAQMTRDGLSFAPAAVGSEAAYRSVYRSLLNYDTDLANRVPPPPPKDKDKGQAPGSR
jgi:hypothetical protein